MAKEKWHQCAQCGKKEQSLYIPENWMLVSVTGVKGLDATYCGKCIPERVQN